MSMKKKIASQQVEIFKRVGFKIRENLERWGSGGSRKEGESDSLKREYFMRRKQ